MKTEPTPVYPQGTATIVRNDLDCSESTIKPTIHRDTLGLAAPVVPGEIDLVGTDSEVPTSTRYTLCLPSLERAIWEHSCLLTYITSERDPQTDDPRLIYLNLRTKSESRATMDQLDAERDELQTQMKRFEGAASETAE